MSASTSLVFVDPAANSQKFWAATLDGSTVTVAYGRLGTTGQVKVKQHPTDAIAARAYDDLVTSKLRKGYVVDPGDNNALDAPSDAVTPVTRGISVPDVRPMLAEEIPADRIPDYVHDDGWWIQQKLDGHRVCIAVVDGTIQVLGRGGQTSQHAPRFAQAAYADVARLPDCVIDGELVGNELYCFDLPQLGGRIGLSSPYSERLEALESLFELWQPNKNYRLLRTARTATEKAELALQCLRAGAEGVMIKAVNGEYKPGRRVKSTLKGKFVHDADFVVTQVGAGGHDNYSLALYRDGELVEVGRCSAIGKVACQPDDVVTVRFLYLAAGDRLYQPRLISRRTDKAPAECDWSQIENARVNKAVLP